MNACAPSLHPHRYPAGCAFSSLAEIAGKRIAVMGLGLNGGGEACARFFLQHGAFVTVTDVKTEAELKPTIDALLQDASIDATKLRFVLGGHHIEDFEAADCVIKNPGVKIEGNRFLAAAKAIETDISIFLSFTKAPIIAVTGSKGKSSTVSAVYYGLKEAGFSAFLGGNITVSPLTFLEHTDATTPVVLELSSWQLADLRGRGILKPRIALITKIVPDHQNWYGNMEDYIADKRLIYAEQSPNDFAIFDAGADENGTGPKTGGTWGDFFASEAKSAVLRYAQNALSNETYGAWLEDDSGHVRLPGQEKSETVITTLSVPGKHMRQNVLNAALIMRLWGVDAEKTMRILSGWGGIEHRLQFFHTYMNEIRFYNDSCATVPEAAAAALNAFKDTVILITGGTDKNLDFLPLVSALFEKNKTVTVQQIFLLSGNGTEKLIAELEKKDISYNGAYHNLDCLLCELKNYLDAHKQGIVHVVFSPGCASFGMFQNEFDRGRQFMEKVKAVFRTA